MLIALMALMALSFTGLAFVVARGLLPQIEPSAPVRALCVMALAIILWINRDYCFFLVAILIAIPASFILEDWLSPKLVRDHVIDNPLSRATSRIDRAIQKRRSIIEKLEPMP